jgi:hypothetical protein
MPAEPNGFGAASEETKPRVVTQPGYLIFEVDRSYAPSRAAVIHSITGLGLLVCHECGFASEECTGWISHLVQDPDDPETPAEVAVYCPLCAEREFEYVSARLTARR